MSGTQPFPMFIAQSIAISLLYLRCKRCMTQKCDKHKISYDVHNILQGQILHQSGVLLYVCMHFYRVVIER